MYGLQSNFYIMTIYIYNTKVCVLCWGSMAVPMKTKEVEAVKLDPVSLFNYFYYICLKKHVEFLKNCLIF